jgi:hypothetical protein
VNFLCLFLFFYSLDLTTLIEGLPNMGLFNITFSDGVILQNTRYGGGFAALWRRPG